MAFSFGFSGEDIDDAMDIDGPEVLTSTSKPETVKTVELSAEHKPTLHSLESLLKDSIGVRMSYSNVGLNLSDRSKPEGVILPRRDLFDVKHQLMLRDNLTATEEILMGLTNEDLRVAQYEGGLKSWECTYDVVEYLATTEAGQSYNQAQTILELGCGTGVPSLFILQQRLSQENSVPLRLVLADYNESVLKLVTVPNLLFTWLETLDSETRLGVLRATSEDSSAIAEARLGEAEITQDLIDEFSKVLKQKSICIEFISGGWSPQFVDLLNTSVLGNSSIPVDLVIASETVYSLDTLPVFTDTLLSIIEKSPSVAALVAAKQVYFGVGGGVLEFEQTLDKHENVTHSTVFTTTGNGQGVARAIVQVGAKQRST